MGILLKHEGKYISFGSDFSFGSMVLLHLTSLNNIGNVSVKRVVMNDMLNSLPYEMRTESLES